MPHRIVTAPELRAPDHPGKNAERDPTGKPWHFWLGGHCDVAAMRFFSSSSRVCAAPERPRGADAGGRSPFFATV